MKKKIVRYLPAILIELFIGLTYLFYRCGPWMYPYRKDWLTMVFIIACLVFFTIGYWLSGRWTKNIVHQKTSIANAAKIVVCLNLALMIPYCLCRTGFYFPHIFSALKNLSLAYARATEAANNYGVLRAIVGFGTFTIYLLYHIVYFYWEELDIRIKILGLTECLWFISVDLCTGRNKGLAVICIMIAIMYIVKMCDSDCRKNRKVFWIRTAITTVFFAIILLYFGKSMGDRGNNTIAQMESTGMSIKEIIMEAEENVDMIVNQYGYVEVETDNANGIEVDNEEYNEYNIKVVPGKISQDIVRRYKENEGSATAVHPYYADEFMYSYVNLDDFVYKHLPGKLKFVYVMGTKYMGHGYYGVTIALRLPFDSCFGLGHLSVLQSKFQSITNIDIYKRSYIYKVNQSGYPVSLNWGTAFLQWASDISFVGVVFLMGILGAFVGRLWDEVLIQRKLITLLLLTSLSVNLLFITSWWQAGMTGTDFILFYGALGVWILEKIISAVRNKKIKINNKENKGNKGNKECLQEKLY